MSINHEPTHHTNPNLQEGEARSLDSLSITTPTPDEIRDQVHPNRRRSVAEILDNRAKRWGAAVAIAVTAIGGPTAAYEIGANATHPSPSTEKTTQPTHDLNGVLPTADATANATGHNLSTSSPSPSSIDTLKSAPTIDTAEPTLDALMSDADKIKAIEIKSGLSADELGQQITGRLSSWGTAGFDKATVDDLLSANYSGSQRDEYATALAAKQTPIYAAALYGKNWQKNLAAQAQIGRFEKVDATSISRRVITDGDPLTYTFGETFNSASLMNGTTTEGTIMVTAVMHENVDQIKRLQAFNPTSSDGDKIQYIVQYHSEDGVVVFDSVNANIVTK